MTYQMQTVRVMTRDGTHAYQRVMVPTKPSKKVQRLRSLYDWSFSGSSVPFDHELRIREQRFMREFVRIYPRLRESYSNYWTSGYRAIVGALRGGYIPEIDLRGYGIPDWKLGSLGRQPAWPWTICKGLYDTPHGYQPRPYGREWTNPPYGITYFPQED